jgi:hypothetical protein
MRIRIIKAETGWWHCDNIGETFNAKEDGTIYDIEIYRIMDRRFFQYYLPRADCEIIQDINPDLDKELFEI